MRRASGGAATTNTTSAERNRECRGATTGREISERCSRQRSTDDRWARVHVNDGRDADARRLDDVDGERTDFLPGGVSEFISHSFLEKSSFL